MYLLLSESRIDEIAKETRKKAFVNNIQGYIIIHSSFCETVNEDKMFINLSSDNSKVDCFRL